MIKKTLLAAIIFAATMMFPFGASANCDLSVKNVKMVSQKYLNGVYARNPMGLKKPKLTVNNKNVRTFYAEELNGVITIYPKSFNDSYCDQYFDGLSPKISEVINHEYTHYIDEKLHISKKIGEKEMSEKTARIGERIFADLLWRNGFAAKALTSSDTKKYNKFMQVIKSSQA